MATPFNIHQITADTKLAEVLRSDLNLMFVLNQFSIPLGFGEKSIREVSLKYEVDCDQLLTMLQFHAQPEKPDMDKLRSLSAELILNYLKSSHTYFLEFRLPDIEHQIDVALSESSTRKTILSYFEEYEREVREHMNYENNVFFPYVEKLIQEGQPQDYSVREYESRHDNIEEKLDDLINLLLKYLPSEGDSYRLGDVLKKLQQCNQELNQHRLLEDEVLVPKIRLLENTPESSRFSAQNKESEGLSEREKDIVCAVAKGLSNKEIADQLFISIHTVITHRRNISRKLSIHSPAGLTVYAILNKLVDIEDLRL
jgi:DNA-binding CsgD family transcriptional regulator/iron-sulfur cluster repair protein YtfE (RIC family)